MDVIHFADVGAFRRWLQKHHDREAEVWVGFYRKDSGKTGMSYPEAVDQALCFGWIDGVRKSVDETSYANRFTPRKPRSTWSVANIRRVGELKELGLMSAAGVAAFEARDPKRSGVYSFENRPQSFPPELEKIFKRNKAAWAFFQAQPPGYRRTMTWWVVSAAKDETKQRRLERLIEESAREKRIT